MLLGSFYTTFCFAMFFETVLGAILLSLFSHHTTCDTGQKKKRKNRGKKKGRGGGRGGGGGGGD